MTTTRVNEYRLTLKQFAQDEGLSVMELLEEYGNESVVPALCTEGCEVEPDGRCEHGCPSLLLAAGVI